MCTTYPPNETFCVSPPRDAAFQGGHARDYGFHALSFCLTLAFAFAFAFASGCDSSQTADLAVSVDTPSVTAADPAGAKVSPPQVRLRGEALAATMARLADVIDLKRMQPRQDEECCTDPGAIADCWWKDADRDGVTCTDDGECSGSNTCNTAVKMDGTTPPNNWGLCTCADDKDCGSGICTDGLCGPSFCNGYLVCSCWGGCTEANSGTYENPGEMCADFEAGFAGACCEGNYAVSNDGRGLGFCSPDCNGMGGVAHCETTADCVDPLPVPYSADCLRWVCDDGLCRADYYHANGVCSDRVQIAHPTYWGTAVRNEGGNVFSCFEGRCDNTGNCKSVTAPANSRYCDDDDDNLCTNERCQNGVCTHDFTGTENDPCNADDNACTLDRCNDIGVCKRGSLDGPDCNDHNLCTEPDVCEDPVPTDDDYIDWRCSNTPLHDGTNLAEYWPPSVFEDTDVCADTICYDGNVTEVPVSCPPPSGLHLQCNEYLCDPEGEEDNCKIFTIRDTLDCDDNNGCTLGEVCDSGNCGSASTTRKVCDDGNVCTEDSCIDGPAGICLFDGTPHNLDRCDDGHPCTGQEIDIPYGNDICFGGVCTAGTYRICTAPAYNDQCNLGGCNETTGGCEKIPQTGAHCDDGDPCTVWDRCTSAGTCSGSAKNCASASDQCNAGICEAGTGNCIASPLANDTACTANDGKGLCTPNDTCQNGICIADTAHEETCAPAPGDPDSVCNSRYCDVDTGDCVFDNARNLNKPCEGVLDDDSCTLDKCVGESASDALTCTKVAEHDISSWYDGAIAGTVSIDGIPGNAELLEDETLGNARGYLLTGNTVDAANDYAGPAASDWKGNDQIWQIDYTGTTSQTLYFSGCHYGGAGSFDGQAILLSCAEYTHAQNDDACGSDMMPEFSVTMEPGETYFLVVDGNGSDDNGTYSMVDDNGTYSMVVYYDTCSDGIQNGDEIGPDSGGAYCCGNDVQNGDEVAPDRGGSCCDDGVMDGDETEVDCGGSYCAACPGPCENGVWDSGEWAVDCGGTCPTICTASTGCDADQVCNTTLSPCGVCLPLACSAPSDQEWTYEPTDPVALPVTEGCVDFRVDELNFDQINYADRVVKLQMMDTAAGSESCDFTSPNYTYAYSTVYCVTYQGVPGRTYEELLACPQWGYTTDSGRVADEYDDVLIPVHQYTRGAMIAFTGQGDNCILDTNIYWQ